MLAGRIILLVVATAGIATQGRVLSRIEATEAPLVRDAPLLVDLA